MAKFRLDSINYISVGKTEKLFNVDISYNEEDNQTSSDSVSSDFETEENATQKLLKSLFEQPIKIEYNKVFIADIDDDTVLGTGESNKFSIESTNGSNQIRIHPIYDINDICIKSSIKKIKNSTAEYKNKSDDYVDIYVPQLEDGILDFCQMDNYSYCLSKRTEKGPTMLWTDLYDQTKTTTPGYIEDESYAWNLKYNVLKTFIYNTSADMTSSDSEVLSNYYKPRYNLTGVKYNYLIEVPQNLPIGTYNDYEAGDIQGDIFQAKNVYDCYYGMNMPDTSSLINTRDYIGLANCGDKIFLKYYDNVDYKAFVPTRVQNSNVDDVVDVATEENHISDYPFQKIETLDSINRFRSNIRHKSPLYSLRISNSGINEFSEEDEKERIKKDIKNNIRTITRKLCPVTTQLFDVFFDS